MLAAVTLLIVSTYLAIVSSAAVERFMPALNDPTPPLAAEPAVLEPASAPLAQRVVLVIIDGLRLTESYRLPLLDALRRRGVDTSAQSHYPTISRPNYVTILTGVPPILSGVRNNFYSQPVLLDSLMDRAAATGRGSAFVGDASHGPAEMFRARAANGHWRDDFNEALFTPWDGGFVTAAQHLAAGTSALVVMLPGAVDIAGHARGAASEDYRAAARQVDAQLADALAGLDFSRDAVIITADHGHTNRGGHGGVEPQVLEVPLVLAGAGIRPGAAVVGAELIDIAPTVAALLGVPAPGHGVGRTLTRALQLTEQAAARIEAADSRRIARNLAVADAARDASAKLASSVRVKRLAWAAVLIGLVIVAILLARRLGALFIDWRVILIALPAFPLTYYALLGIFGQQYSPSFIPMPGRLLDKLLRFGLISTGVTAIACWIALHGRVVLAKRLAAANGLVACGLVTALIPAAIAWISLPTSILQVPRPALFMLVPATYVAVACYAISVTVSLGLELIVFFARAVDPRLHRFTRSRWRRDTWP